MAIDAERTRFVDWLSRQVIADARGDRITSSTTKPADRLWLGRLAPEDASWKIALGERGQRLDPCSCGFRFRPKTWAWKARVSFCVWQRDADVDGKPWVKSDRVSIAIDISLEAKPHTEILGTGEIRAALDAAGIAKHSARIEIVVEPAGDAPGELDVTVVIVNMTPSAQRGVDTNIYEVRLALEVGELQPIYLDALPDSFRYDRRVEAFGIYGGHRYEDGVLSTTDVVVADRARPGYWDATVDPAPSLEFKALANDPTPQLEALVVAHRSWGELYWAETRLDVRERDERWTPELRAQADHEGARYADETARLTAGIEALADPVAFKAFVLMNAAFEHSSRGKYSGWRPFQMGFFLSVLPSLIDPDEARRDVVDTLWFATGGGKTETYLAAIVFLCLHDRLTGKQSGISVWSRFPLRMLSLQQTQRFADALAGAELQQEANGLGGDPIGLGFLVGGPPNGTPNRIRDDPKDGEADANDRDMPARHQVLLHCPYCFSDAVTMRFNRALWRLEHHCGNSGCDRAASALPFFCVDEEIYRFLPSVIVGTLDKAASVGIQAALRGVYASPIARCSREGHGFTYTPRKATPIGCLVPNCDGKRETLGQPRARFAPTLRIQDELHLLRDSLGAIDSHYETLLDHLQQANGGPLAKILASSATLAGFEQQSRELYNRPGTVFPLAGPEPGASFWTCDSDALARRFVGLAPRGQTLEFANDRVAESLQRAVRRLRDEPQATSTAIGVSPTAAVELLDEYGTHVVYGTKVRDVEAAARSFETQPGVSPLNVEQLTGRTSLEDVRATLERLERPEATFEDRLHIVCASSMMSHGVDVERFNVITMLGLPLATAEFIQTTARIGRRYPGLVLVLHRMGVERDSSVFRAFSTYVRQGDRFIEPVAITRRSKRVLDHTFAGLFMARVLGLHEPGYYASSQKSLVLARDFRLFNQAQHDFEATEFASVCEALGLDPAGDDPLVDEVREHMRLTMREANDVASKAVFTSEVPERPPMRSLREVETQITIRSVDE